MDSTSSYHHYLKSIFLIVMFTIIIQFGALNSLPFTVQSDHTPFIHPSPKLDRLGIDICSISEQISSKQVVVNEKFGKPLVSGFSLSVSPVNYQSSLYKLFRIGNREVGGKIIDTGTALTALLFGDKKPLLLDFDEFRSQLGHVRHDHLTTLEIREAPGTIIENQIFNGTSIRIIDSPYSVVKNNTVMNINRSSDDINLSAISLLRCTHSVIENNNIHNITFNSTINSIQGIYLGSSDHSTIKNNSIDNLFASITSYLNTTESISTDAHVSVHGIYLETSSYSPICFNSIKNLFSSTHASAKGGFTEASAYSETYGIYLASSENITLDSNYLNDLMADARTVRGYGNASANTSGIHAISCKNLSLNSNTVNKISTTANAHYIFANTRTITCGIQIVDSNHSKLISNSMSHLTTISSSTTSVDARVYGIYMMMSNEATLDSNRISYIYSDAEASRFNFIHAWANGIYLVNSDTSLIIYNTICNITSRAVHSKFSDVVAPAVSAWTCGIQVITDTYTTISYNDIIKLDASASAHIKAEAYVYGIHLLTRDQSILDSNTIDELSVNAFAESNHTTHAVTHVIQTAKTVSGWTIFILLCAITGLYISYNYRESKR